MTKRAKVGGLVLAAGLSRRFGDRNKLLYEVDGEAVVRRVCVAMLSAGLSPLYVVLGYQRSEMEKALEDLEVKTVFNERFEQGMGTSLAVGIKAMENACVEGVCVSLGDLPWLGAADVLKVRLRFEETMDSVVLPVKDGQRGHPVCFPRQLFAQLALLDGDRGAKEVIRNSGKVVEMEGVSSGCFQDLDERP